MLRGLLQRCCSCSFPCCFEMGWDSQRPVRPPLYWPFRHGRNCKKLKRQILNVLFFLWNSVPWPGTDTQGSWLRGRTPIFLVGRCKGFSFNRAKCPFWTLKATQLFLTGLATNIIKYICTVLYLFILSCSTWMLNEGHIYCGKQSMLQMNYLGSVEGEVLSSCWLPQVLMPRANRGEVPHEEQWGPLGGVLNRDSGVLAPALVLQDASAGWPLQASLPLRHRGKFTHPRHSWKWLCLGHTGINCYHPT